MLDKLDYKILEAIQRDNHTPQRDIGEKIGLSAAAVQRRMKKMRELGVIEKNIAVINRDKIGHNVTILVEVFLESEKIELIESLKKEFLLLPEIQQCYYVTGDADFFLVIVVPSMTYYENFTREIFFVNRNIRRFRTVVVMEIAKNTLEIPLDLIVSSKNS